MHRLRMVTSESSQYHRKTKLGYFEVKTLKQNFKALNYDSEIWLLKSKVKKSAGILSIT